MPAPSRSARAPRELLLLLTLATVQFTHIVDFMVMMPLGPQFMRLFNVGPREFGFLVSSYTFAAAVSGFVAAFWIDRCDRKHALLALYAGFILATALCGLAPTYELLLATRVGAGLFGGVIGGLVFAIIADVVPYARRARATALVATSFSLAAVAGVPLALWLAARFSWRTPFLVLAGFSVLVALGASRLMPPLAAHLAGARRRGPLAQLVAVFGERNHLRAFAFMIVLMFAGFSVIPFIAPTMVANVGLTESELPLIYFCGGLSTLVTAQIIGHLADRYGKQRLFTIVALASLAPIILITHLPRLPLASALTCAVVFFVLVTGRFGPAMALVSGSAESRLRGSFLSFNASVQMVGAALASLGAGLIIRRGPDGTLLNFGAVGWLAAACTLLCVVLVRRIRTVADVPHAVEDRAGRL
jgi:predicted MFS family arabinose efflux permease